ncbi:AAA family ATPase [Streptomyces sp. NPDC054765]
MIEHNDLPGNATNVEQWVRANLIAAAKRHQMPAVALVVATPAEVCVDRQKPRLTWAFVVERVTRIELAL